MSPASESSASFAFGRFLVLRHRRELLADDQPIRLGGRAFDVLMALIEARGAVVSKDALMARVWPDRVVEENNLQSQIMALRRAFGAERDLIRTISGRGYQFTGEIRVLPGTPEQRSGAGLSASDPRSAPASTNLPEPASELIGRDAELREIPTLAGAHRLVTLAGAGGIGKTCLALAAAHQLRSQFADGVWLAELAPLADPALVPAIVAAAAGIELTAGTLSPERVANALSGKRLLLVLDNCEHVIDAAAAMAEALLRANPAGHVIATSREPLRAEGEWVYPVPALALPPDDVEAQDDRQQYGAVRLFAERARAAEPHFTPHPDIAPIIAVICRRLDGIPLAIELAAARAATLGVEALSASLEDRFSVLTGGRRTALPRHQTLRATLDWSYELLTEPERLLLRRLGVFAGAFSLQAAGAVAASADLAREDVVDGLSHLVAKSLVAVNVDIKVARYTLLDTTRAYAREKLAESGELDRVARRHAEYGRDLLDRPEFDLERLPSNRLLADHWRVIDNLRASLDWTFSPNGDASLGVALTAAALPLWMDLSLMAECRSRAEQALAAMAAGASQDAPREMKLKAALGVSLIMTRGAAAPEIAGIWTRVLEIAESLDDVDFQLRALWGLWSFHLNTGHPHLALELAQRFCSRAATPPDANDRLVGERMIGVAKHLLGDQPGARRHIEQFLAHYDTIDQRSVFRYHVDQRVTGRVYLARILWLQGFPDQAMQTAEASVDEARTGTHAMSLCSALAQAACQIAFLVGDLATAGHYVAMLLDHSRKHGLATWHAWGRCYEGVLIIQRGDLGTGLQLLRSGLDERGDATSALQLLTFLSGMAEALGRAGHIAEAIATIDDAIGRAERAEERWRMAEFLRIKGELLLLQGAKNTAAMAEDHFRQALGWARQQGALSWELRAAISLARLLRDQGRSADASALLQPIYDRFTEGFGAADLKAARALLDEIR